ncbi:hypothetical protein CC86DRAFT_139650 [Ophiobolus disseminans]|uniref:Uncharacterized protein n=1 Tax=Ophiobolus disseminans TaxID=1469910 RepID=A0A6A7AE32_9PLEO|nr:hypothetical protein CC86DRAFT_139650 [Ophiobolus disseminans]
MDIFHLISLDMSRSHNSTSDPLTNYCKFSIACYPDYMVTHKLFIFVTSIVVALGVCACEYLNANVNTDPSQPHQSRIGCFRAYLAENCEAYQEFIEMTNESRSLEEPAIQPSGDEKTNSHTAEEKIPDLPTSCTNPRCPWNIALEELKAPEISSRRLSFLPVLELVVLLSIYAFIKSAFYSFLATVSYVSYRFLSADVTIDSQQPPQTRFTAYQTAVLAFVADRNNRVYLTDVTLLSQVIIFVVLLYSGSVCTTAAFGVVCWLKGSLYESQEREIFDLKAERRMLRRENMKLMVKEAKKEVETTTKKEVENVERETAEESDEEWEVCETEE